jgi:hypothetical protein
VVPIVTLSSNDGYVADLEISEELGTGRELLITRVVGDNTGSVRLTYQVSAAWCEP